MMRFVDGPAVGVMLQMRLTPIVLRAVKNPRAQKSETVWDCLNEPGDVAKPHEEIYVYILAGRPQSVHLCCSPRSRSGWYSIGVYRQLTVDPPDDATMRDNQRWSDWCEANKARLLPAWANIREKHE
jgi:hypothetical protein